MKFTKIFIAIAFLVLLSNQGFTQKSSSECKFEVDKTDAKTGKPIKKIKIKLSGTDVFYIIISRNDTAYQLGLNFWIAGAFNNIIYKGDVMTMLMSGDQTLKFHALENTKPTPHYSDQTWSEYSPEYFIRATDVEKLKSVAPKNLKLKVGDEQIYWEFTVKDLDKIRDMVRCIMK